MADQPSGERASEKPVRRRWQRVLRVALMALAAFAVLVVLLPTIASLLPLGSIISSKVNDGFGGTVRIDRVRLGWFSASAIGRVDVYETKVTDGTPLLHMEDIVLDGGLLKLLMAGKRRVGLHVKALSVKVVRDADGVMNYAKFLPPAAPGGGKTPKTAKPFALKGLLPETVLPVASLDLRIDKYTLDYADEGGDVALPRASAGGSIEVGWAGDVAPLTATITGGVSAGGATVPIRIGAVLEDWTSVGRLAMDNASLTATVDRGSGEPFIVSKQKLDGNSVSGSLVIDLGQVSEFLVVAPAESRPPALKGLLVVESTLVTPPGESMLVTTKARTEGLSIGGLGSTVAPLAIPNLALDARGRVDSTSFEPGILDAKLNSTIGNAVFADRPLSTGAHESSLTITLNPSRAISLLMSSRFAPAQIPDVDGDIAITARVLHTLDTVESCDIQMDWVGRTLRWREPPPLPEGMRLRNEAMNLAPTSFHLVGNGTRDASGALRIAVRGDNNLLAMSGAGTGLSLDEASASITIHAKLDEVDKFLRSEMVMPDDIATSGVLEIAVEATRHLKTIRHSGSAYADNLLVRHPLLPHGELSDDLSIAWNGTVEMESALHSLLDATLASRFADARVTSDITAGGRIVVVGESALHLEALVALAPEDMLPAAVTNPGGTVIAKASVRTDTPRRYEVQAEMSSGDDFALPLLGGVAELQRFFLGTSTTLQFSDEGFAIELHSSTATMGDFLTGGMTGTITRSGTATEWALRPEADMDLAALSSFASPILIEMQNAELRADGLLTVSSMLEGESDQDAGGGTVLRSMHANALVQSEQFVADYITTEGFTRAKVDNLFLAVDAESGKDGSLTVRLDRTAVELISVETPQMAVELPPLRIEGGVILSSDYSGFTINKVRVDAPGAFEASLDGSGALDRDLYKLTGSARLVDPSRLFVALRGDTAGLAPVEMTGVASAEMTMDVDGSLALPEGGIFPLNANAAMKAQWSDIGMRHERYDLRGLGGTVTADLSPSRVGAQGDAALAGFWMDGVEVDVARGLSLTTSLLSDQSGALFLREFRVSSPRYGSSLYFRTTIQDFLKRLEGFRSAGEPADQARVLLDFPFETFAGFSADLAHLPLGPSIQIDAGRAEGTLHARNYPGRQLDVEVDQKLDDWRGGMPDLVDAQGMRGSLPVARSYFTGRAMPAAPPAKPGRFSADVVHVSHPLLTGEIRKAIADISTGAELTTARVLCESFFGGPANANVRLTRDGGDPAAQMDFSLTGFDAVALYPGLKGVDVRRRTANGFGSLRVRLREQPNMNRLLDDMLFRFEFTDIGSDVVREMLRSMDLEGSNPGIQATLVSLRFSRPVRIIMEIRGGLLNFSILLVNPAGVPVNIPLFERANVANLLEGRVDASFNDRLAMTRVALGLLLANRLDDLLQMLPKGESLP